MLIHTLSNCFLNISITEFDSKSRLLLLLKKDITRISRANKMMCNVSLKNGRSSEELRDRLEVLYITKMLRRNKLKWFGHDTRMDVGNPARACKYVEVKGKREKGTKKNMVSISKQLP